ncbi:ABC transporter ATP-binding protein [Pseudacidovorax sp.]|uniref:ABC transporter ATP-binding protein n=1 Tax=Pseudacidovorax sp. TaxID=1934311 RepID=UPI0025E2650A|nr:ABC transporter ATP-binding protein [Pseudacidovorax sp.]
MSAAPVLEARSLRFGWPGAAAPCIDIDHLAVAADEPVFLYGPSGCGKSTLLSLLAGVLLADAGDVRLLGQDWSRLGGSARDRRRVDHVGYIFQQFNLLPYLSVMDNVLLPLRFSPRRRAEGSRAQAEALLARMGLDATLWSRSALQLSVGQQQRVAAARALVGRPELVIADEPTSALDEERREAFLDTLLAACQEAGSALVLVSHDPRIAQRFARQLHLPSLNKAATAVAASAA